MTVFEWILENFFKGMNGQKAVILPCLYLLLSLKVWIIFRTFKLTDKVYYFPWYLLLSFRVWSILRNFLLLPRWPDLETQIHINLSIRCSKFRNKILNAWACSTSSFLASIIMFFRCKMPLRRRLRLSKVGLSSEEIKSDLAEDQRVKNIDAWRVQKDLPG